MGARERDEQAEAERKRQEQELMQQQQQQPGGSLSDFQLGGENETSTNPVIINK